MAYEIKTDKRLGREICRIARRQVQCAIKHLKEKNSKGAGESVHEARKNLKKVRGLIRLVRANLGEKPYKKENGSFREIAQVLSPQRDAEVLIKTLEKFRSAHRVTSLNPALTKLRKLLLKQKKEVTGKVRNESKQLMKDLKSARQRPKEWPLGKIKKSDLCRGVKTTYQRGRKAYQKVRVEPSPENLHEWRKRVKDLGYQFSLIKQFGSKELDSFGSDLTNLGDRLGDDHDLVMLEAAARAASLTQRESAGISKSIAASRKPLQESAFQLGKRLYAEKPKAFVIRVKKDWKKQKR